MLPFGGAGLFNIGKTVVGGTAGALLATSASLTTASIADVATGQLLASQGSGVVPAFSASPTLTTSLTVPALYGSSGSGGNLLLQSTSNATRGLIQAADLMQIVTTAYSWAATSGYAMTLFPNNTDITTGSFGGIGFTSNLTVKGNSTLTVCALFNAQMTIKDDGTARTIGPALLFASEPTYTATVAGTTVADVSFIPGYCGLYYTLTTSITGGGTLAMTTAAGVYISKGVSIGTGTTLTNLCGMLIDYPNTVTGTLTNFYGVKNNGAAGTNRWFLYETGGMQSSHKGKLRIGDNTAPTEQFEVTGTLKSDQFTANGAVATTMTSLGPTGSHTTIQEWLQVKNAAGTIRYIPAY